MNELESLQRELRATQEMLALVLKSVGEPVVVTKEIMNQGLPADAQIRIDEDLPNNAFVFSLGKVGDE